MPRRKRAQGRVPYVDHNANHAARSLKSVLRRAQADGQTVVSMEAALAIAEVLIVATDTGTGGYGQGSTESAISRARRLL